jgi:RNA polymerase sigma-70 factor (ECF subfamily)
MAGEPSSARFPTTAWSRILEAGGPAQPQARAALEDLCRDYWYPLYAFLRRKGLGAESAQDLVQSLFADLLARNDLRGLDPARGRFRSYLMACATHLLAKQRARERAARRGGGRAILALDSLAAESRYGVEPSHELTAERLFDHRWALTVLDLVLAGLDDEMARSNRSRLYEQLRPSLLAQPDARPYSEIADGLGMTEAAVKMAAHRLRARYRERLRDEIARTVADPAEIDDENSELLSALST